MRKGVSESLLVLAIGALGLSVPPARADDLSEGFAAASAVAASARAQLEAAAVQRPQAPAAAMKNRVDLSAQFPPRKIHNQGTHGTSRYIGACHIFSTIAVAEAAYYRRYKVHLALSEADLFAQVQIAGGAIVNQAGPSVQADGKVKYKLGEGGEPLHDLRFLLSHGVLPNSRDAVDSYASFLGNYKKNFERPVAESMMKLAQLGIPAPPRVAPGQLALTAAQLEGLTPEAALMRQNVKQSFSGFKIKNQKFGKPLGYDALRSITPEACESSSSEQREFILSELNAGRPVVMSFDLRGLPAWGAAWAQADDGPRELDGHAFLITSYYTNSKGRLIFKTRNSHVAHGKPSNPDVPSNQLCRTESVLSLLTPEEAAADQAVASASPAPTAK